MPISSDNGSLTAKVRGEMVTVPKTEEERLRAEINRQGFYSVLTDAKEIERMENDDGSAFGAALLAGVRTGLFASVEEAVATCVRVRETIQPNPAWFPAYDSGYARFRTLYPAVHST